MRADLILESRFWYPLKNLLLRDLFSCSFICGSDKESLNSGSSLLHKRALLKIFCRSMLIREIFSWMVSEGVYNKTGREATVGACLF